MTETSETDAIAKARESLAADTVPGALAALAALDGAPASVSAQPEAEMLRARAQMHVAEPEDVLRSLMRAAEAGAPPAELRALYDRLLARDEPLDAKPHAHFLSWLIERVDDAELAMSLVRLQVARRRPGRAGVAARRALDLDPTRPLAYRMAYVAALRSEDPSAAIDYVRAALERSEGDPRFPSLKSTMMGLPSEEAQELMAELSARWPASLASGARTGDLQTEDVGPALLAQKAYLRALEGDRDEAMRLAAEARAEAGDRPLAVREQVMEEVIRAIPGPEAQRRPLVVDEGREVTRSGPSETGVTLLVLTNLTHRANYDHVVLDAFASAAGAAAIYLRDFSYRLFIGGVAELGPDRAATMAALREELVALGTQRLVVMGTSAGAYSAPSYGRELGAAHVLGLGTPTTIGRFLSGGDTRVKTLIRKLKANFPPEDLDLREVLPRIGGTAPVELWYGAERSVDADHAGDLQGMEGISLHPLAGHADHQILPKLIANGMFQRWLEP